MALRYAFVHVLLASAALTAVACGSASSAPSPSAKPTPKPTPAPPEKMSVTVVANGVGAWQLVAIPVAVLRNDATMHGAQQVVVHFTTHSSGGSALGSLDSPPVNLGPGETMPVAADCTDGCDGAATADVSVMVGRWTKTTGATFKAGTAVYTCVTGACGGGHGQGTAKATLTTTGVGSGTTFAAFAACTDASGAIVGAGVTQSVWAGGKTQAVTVPVIVNASPATCQVGASTGW